MGDSRVTASLELSSGNQVMLVVQRSWITYCLVLKPATRDTKRKLCDSIEKMQKVITKAQSEMDAIERKMDEFSQK